MSRCALPLLVFGVCIVCVPARAATEAEQAMVGAWQISNAARDKVCPLSFTVERVERGLKVELDGACPTAFPSMKDIVAWSTGKNDSVQLIDSKEQLRSMQRTDLKEFTFIDKSPMPSFRGKLSPLEITDLVSYLVSLQGGAQ